MPVRWRISSYEDLKRWDTLAQLGLAINDKICAKGFEVTQMHQPKVFQLMQKVIQKSWKKSEGVDKLTRWIRCLFLIAVAKDEKVALHCLSQAVVIDEQSRMASSANGFSNLKLTGSRRIRRTNPWNQSGLHARHIIMQ
jgi:hypothetical protein